eukprot:gene11316-15178_t
MIRAALVVPFSNLPRKEWHTQIEKKSRLHPSLYTEEEEHELHDYDDEDSEFSHDGSKHESEKSEDDFSYLAHIENLLPSDSNVAVNKSYLEDLRPPPPKSRLRELLRIAGNKFHDWKEYEIKRRKHYLLKEYERKVHLYDKTRKEMIAQEMAEQQKMVLVEAYRKQERIRLNSKEKVAQSVHIERFAKDIEKRNKQNLVTDFYTTYLTKWANEAYYKNEQITEQNQIMKENERRIQQELINEQKKQALIKQDELIIQEDIKISANIKEMMIKYGLIEYDVDMNQNEHKKINEIIDKSTALFKKKKALLGSTSSEIAFDENRNNDEDESKLILKLKKGKSRKEWNIILCDNKKKLRNKKLQTIDYTNPFETNIQSTGDVMTVKGTFLL